ncbi:MAG: hypothetical protein ACTSSP_02985 [Candidatus Asgardarchaeia archaeon]
MKKFKHVNWSKAIREKIEEIIEKEESRNLAIALLLNEKAVITLMRNGVAPMKFESGGNLSDGNRS